MDKKERGDIRIVKKDSVKSLPVRNRGSKTIDVKPRENSVQIGKKRTFSKPVETKVEKRRYSQGIVNTITTKNNFITHQSPVKRAKSPYLQEIRKVEVKKYVSQTHLTRFEKKLVPLHKKSKKGKKEIVYNKN